MSFVLQPFNYFDSDPTQDVDDALSVLADADTGRLVYQRQGHLDQVRSDRHWEQWRPKAPPATQNASQKSLGGDKNMELKGGGQNLPFCFKGK